METNVMEDGDVVGVLGDDGNPGIGGASEVTGPLGEVREGRQTDGTDGSDGSDGSLVLAAGVVSISLLEEDGSPAPQVRVRRVKDVADKRTYDGRRVESGRTIEKVVMAVAQAQGVAWQGLFTKTRGANDVSLARAIAMAMCCELGVPLCHTARTFNRDWATVYTAEQRCGRRYQGSAAFREMWDGVLEEVRRE